MVLNLSKSITRSERWGSVVLGMLTSIQSTIASSMTGFSMVSVSRVELDARKKTVMLVEVLAPRMATQKPESSARNSSSA
jgi:hypothetical protein